MTLEAGPIAEATATREAGLGPDEQEYAPCHVTRAADVLLDSYAIETPTCCGLSFMAHDETVTDHLVRSRRIWNAHLHDLVDSIERQVREALVSEIGSTEPDSTLPTHEKHNTAGIGTGVDERA